MSNHSTLSIPYILHLADNCLILSQRNSEWCGHGPVLEQDIALTNITLDLLGQARLLYQLAATRINEQKGNEEATEDTLAYLRDERQFTNILLNELPKGNWGFTILRLYLFSAYQNLLYKKLQEEAPEELAAIAEKSLKEVKYHLTWSRDWVLRLGDGTEESHDKMEKALQDVWMYTGEMFISAAFDDDKLLKEIQADWNKQVTETLQEATLTIPPETFMQTGGKEGVHTEHLGYILAEMQYLQRMYPNATW
jgi:ring-1,2-phenylacetyl-CoA epoxidase subunit PaaC